MATFGHLNNYTLGRGEVYFDRFEADGVTLTGRRYLGNTPGFGLTIGSEKLDHFSADGGIRVKDESVVLETSMTGTLSCDNISRENLALFFFGSSSIITQTAIGSPTAEDIEVEAGMVYQVGVTSVRPTGLRKLTTVSAAIKTPNTPLAAWNGSAGDYILDADLGTIEILTNANFPAGTRKVITVTYQAQLSTREQIVSGTSAIQGALWLKSANPVGVKRDFYMPKVELIPNGEYNLKGEDWSVMEFSVEVLKQGNFASLYVDGVATV